MCHGFRIVWGFLMHSLRSVINNLRQAIKSTECDNQNLNYSCSRSIIIYFKPNIYKLNLKFANYY